MREEIRDGGRLLLKSARLMGGTEYPPRRARCYPLPPRGPLREGGSSVTAGTRSKQRPSARAKALMWPFKRNPNPSGSLRRYIRFPHPPEPPRCLLRISNSPCRFRAGKVNIRLSGTVRAVTFWAGQCSSTGNWFVPLGNFDLLPQFL